MEERKCHPSFKVGTWQNTLGFNLQALQGFTSERSRMVQNAATQDHGAVPMKLLQATSIASKMFRCQLTPVTALCVLQCRGTLIPKIPELPAECDTCLFAVSPLETSPRPTLARCQSTEKDQTSCMLELWKTTDAESQAPHSI